jgi:hypothetical protein
LVKKSNQNNQLMKKTEIYSRKAFCRKTKTKVEETSSLKPGNLNEIVLESIPVLTDGIKKKKNTATYTLHETHLYCMGEESHRHTIVPMLKNNAK